MEREIIIKKLSFEDFLRLRKIVFRNSRPIDFTMWSYLFEDGSCDEYLSVLASYQNEDGGFGHNLECNNWNPNSSPYTVCIALDYLDIAKKDSGEIKKSIIEGIVDYLSTCTYRNAEGFVGMQGIPSNNEYAHLPWFHYDAEKGKKADIGVTKRLAEFLLQYADENSGIYEEARQLRDKYSDCGQILLGGVPDLDPKALDMKDFQPDTWPFYIPRPLYFVGSPQSELYAELRDVVNQNLDDVVEKLEKTNEAVFATEQELAQFEKYNPHPEGKRWCVPEQTIGNYYWESHHIVGDVNMLREFDRLAFALPVLVKNGETK